MKKLICLLLALIMVLSLVGCGGDETPDEPDNTPGESQDPGNDNPPDWAGKNESEGIETPIIPIP